MINIILLIGSVISLTILGVLFKTNKLQKESVLRNLLVIICVLIPLLIGIEYDLYHNTETFNDFAITTICFCAVIGSIALYAFVTKKFGWPGYLLFGEVYIIYRLIVITNHYLLAGIKANMILIWGAILLVSWYRALEKVTNLKLGIGALAIVIFFFIQSEINIHLKYDSTIARAVINYAIDEGMTDSRDVDLIIYDPNNEGEYVVRLFYDRMSSYEKTYNYSSRFHFYDGKVSLIEE
jgi:hypothetical protein